MPKSDAAPLPRVLLIEGHGQTFCLIGLYFKNYLPAAFCLPLFISKNKFISKISISLYFTIKCGFLNIQSGSLKPLRGLEQLREYAATLGSSPLGELGELQSCPWAAGGQTSSIPFINHRPLGTLGRVDKFFISCRHGLMCTILRHVDRVRSTLIMIKMKYMDDKNKWITGP